MITVGAIFTNGMILQRNSLVTIWGETDCTYVDIKIKDAFYSVKSEEGKWSAKIHTGEAGEVLTMIISGENRSGEVASDRIVIEDILLGDVWLAGGQSNMELELQNSMNAKEVMAKADYEEIRFYNVPKCPVVDDDLIAAEKNSKWRKVKSGNIADMSAVAFYFATKIYEETKVPIGIIDCYWGGTSASCWVSPKELEDVIEVRGYLDDWAIVIRNTSEEEFDNKMQAFNDDFNAWLNRVDTIKKENPGMDAARINELAGECPWPPPKGGKSAYRPFGLHESMVMRVAPYGLKGVIYYQAEEDGERASYYNKLNSAVVRQWRHDFENDCLPFYITQLPMYISAGVKDDRSWAVLRDSQEKCSIENDNVGIAVLIDCGEYDNIHPVDKEIPGYRLASQVLENTYHHPAGRKNMKLTRATFYNDSCRLALENTYGAICYRPSDGTTLTSRKENIIIKSGEDCTGLIYGLEVSSNGDDFYSPEIEIDKDVIVVRGKNQEELVAVSYGWFNYGVANIYSNAGLALMPFKIYK